MRFYLTFFLLLSTLVSYSQDYSTPEDTFRTLLISIQTEDLNMFKECWVEDRADKEGMFAALSEDPSKWQELKDKFSGPQELTQMDFVDNKVGSWFISDVSALESESNPIGKISMLLINDQWKMYSW